MLTTHGLARVHVGQNEEIAGEGAGKQFNDAGVKSVVVIIHEASNSGLTDRAKGVKKTFKGTTKTLLIPNAKADIPGTQAIGHERLGRA